jgi:hypothetical protein
MSRYVPEEGHRWKTRDGKQIMTIHAVGELILCADEKKTLHTYTQGGHYISRFQEHPMDLTERVS